ncbi:hypothetical protein E3N88_39114 [Mikania micrantha]|uniref:Uncharacterized protein n=1 Tax=Mikania micrantha TaxID=192012 RepID=A0A5N6LW26_9ASTR|nr:hypothetical protein E3N88_39114 [Mikania micrantha]
MEVSSSRPLISAILPYVPEDSNWKCNGDGSDCLRCSRDRRRGCQHGHLLNISISKCRDASDQSDRSVDIKLDRSLKFELMRLGMNHRVFPLFVVA